MLRLCTGRNILYPKIKKKKTSFQHKKPRNLLWGMKDQALNIQHHRSKAQFAVTIQPYTRPLSVLEKYASLHACIAILLLHL